MLKNETYKPRNWYHGFKIALTGLWLIFKNERNFRIQLVFAVLVYTAAFALGFNHSDLVGISLVIALVLITEAFNSVVEAICDTVSQDYRVNIKYAKDVSAGAVLISTGVSIIAGVFVFLPYLLRLANLSI